MHIYFIGIGGTGIGPLALLASQAGYEVSGSDNKESEYTRYLKAKGIKLWTDQSGVSMAKLHTHKPIDWVISVSAITHNTPDHPELVFAREHGIRITERDAGLNEILKTKGLKMIAAAGTHGKTTTTAMLVWTMQNLGIPISYSVGAKMSFADMGHYEPDSQYFVYECDEFHRNFLQFYPFLSIISGVSWDHHEVYPTKENYNEAFIKYISQSKKTLLWDNDAVYLGVSSTKTIEICNSNDPDVHSLTLAGLYNRRNAWLVAQALHKLLGTPLAKLITILNAFPGTQRRMEELSPGLFSDYAHTPEKIIGCMSVAQEIAKLRRKNVVVIYEPLTNRRQHFIKLDYKNCFRGAEKVYWVPSYLARENPAQAILGPAELITYLEDPTIAEPAVPGTKLWETIQKELKNAIVVCMTGGGGESLDEWLRAMVKESS